MDDRLKTALESANFMVTFNNQKEVIKQTFKIIPLLLFNLLFGSVLSRSCPCRG